MTLKRTISLTLTLSLLLSLLLPAVGGSHSCGAAEAAEARVSKAQKAPAHACHGCSRAAKSGVARSRSIVIKLAPAETIPYSRQSFCCTVGNRADRRIVDVPTLTSGPITAQTAVLVALIDHSALPNCRRGLIAATYKIGSSPPFLAFTEHYTYLHTSTFLI